MFTHIRTSKENHEIVSTLTRRLNLGPENIISRIALSYSISLGRKFKLTNIKDSGGKEYSRKVLFGNFDDYYLGMVAVHYEIHISDKDLGRYIKIHIDDGLQLLNKEIKSNPNLDGFQFLVRMINIGLQQIN